MHGLFVTGTDTNVGKTYVSCLIANALKQKNINVIPRKPVESGCIEKDGQLIAADAESLAKACNFNGHIDEVCPYKFSPAISPAWAAQLANQQITITELVNACTPHHLTDNDFMLVEGAGGFMSPLCSNALNADLAAQLQLPVALVVKDKLGCINHTLLTLEAIQSRQLKTSVIFLNQIAEESKISSNSDELSQLTKLPIYKISYIQDALNPKSIQNIA